MTLHGKVVAISISTKKGTPKSNVTSAEFVESWGIQGDAHAGNWHRQVSLLALESIDRMRIRGAMVEPGNFAENVTVQGFEISQLQIGDLIQLGSVELEVTQIGKECHQHCAIYQQIGDCVMPREGIFGKVIVGGLVRVGEEVRATTTKEIE